MAVKLVLSTSVAIPKKYYEGSNDFFTKQIILTIFYNFFLLFRSPNKKVSDAVLYKLNITAFIIIFLSIGINFTVHKLTDHPFSIVAETCARGDEGREIQWPAKTWSILNLLIFQVFLKA